MALPPRRPIKPVATQKPAPSAPSKAPAAPLATKKPAPSAPPKAPAAPKNCAKCQAELAPGSAFCGECGAPVKAGMKPKRSLQEVRRSLEQGRNTRLIHSGTKTLLWLSILNIVGGGLIYLMEVPKVQEMGPEAVKLLGIVCVIAFVLPGVIFLGLWFWAKQNPLPATIAGMITYITFMIAGLALNPAGALSPGAWIIRIAIIGALSNAIKSASTERKIQQRQREKEEKARRAREAAGEAAEAEAEEEEAAG